MLAVIYGANCPCVNDGWVHELHRINRWRALRCVVYDFNNSRRSGYEQSIPAGVLLVIFS